MCPTYVDIYNQLAVAMKLYQLITSHLEPQDYSHVVRTCNSSQRIAFSTVRTTCGISLA